MISVTVLLYFKWPWLYCTETVTPRNCNLVGFRWLILFWWQSWIIDMLSGGLRHWSKRWNSTIGLVTTSRWWMLTERCWPTSSQLLHAITVKNASTTSLTSCQMVLIRTWSCFRSSIRPRWRLWRKPKMRLIFHFNVPETRTLVLLNYSNLLKPTLPHSIFCLLIRYVMITYHYTQTAFVANLAIIFLSCNCHYIPQTIRSIFLHWTDLSVFSSLNSSVICLLCTSLTIVKRGSYFWDRICITLVVGLQDFCMVTFDAILNFLRVFLFVQRLWFKTNLKLCKLWFDMGEYGRMNKVSLLINFLIVNELLTNLRYCSKNLRHLWSSYS